MRFARKGSRKKWEPALAAGAPLPADPINDFRVDDGSLSVWEASTDELKDLVIATFTAMAERPGVIDLLWIDETVLDRAGTSRKATVGQTVIDEAKAQHWDVGPLSMDALVSVIDQLRRREPSQVVERITEQHALQALASRVSKGDPLLRDVSPRIVEAMLRRHLVDENSALEVLAEALRTGKVCEHDLQIGSVEQLRSTGLFP